MKRIAKSLLGSFLFGAVVVAATLVTCHAARNAAGSMASLSQQFIEEVQAYLRERN